MKAVDTERYVRQMRKAMNAAEEIAGDTETPWREREAAIKRIVTFWEALLVECGPKHQTEDDHV